MMHVRNDMNYETLYNKGTGRCGIADRAGSIGNMPWPYFGLNGGDNRILLSSTAGMWGILCIF